jgi:hypothetical protein
MFQAIDLIKKGSCWQIGNGKSTDIWEDNWIIWQNGYKILTPPPRQTNLTTVSKTFFLLKELSLNKPHSRWKTLRICLCGPILMKEATLSSLVITFENIGKLLITLALQPLPITIPLGKRYGAFIPFLDTKLCFG